MLLNFEKVILNWTLSKPSRAPVHMHFPLAQLVTEDLPCWEPGWGHGLTSWLREKGS